VYETHAELRATLDLVAQGTFSDGDKDRYSPLLHSLIEHDAYMLLADFDDYVATQRKVSRAFADRADFYRRGVLNVARSGRFSSDRSIAEYCSQIWKAEPVDVSATELWERVPQE
jgi:starch phosphorylase